MMSVVEANTVAIVIALLIGLVTGWWAFKAVRAVTRAPSDGRSGDTLEVRPPPQDLRPAKREPIRDGVDTPEGNNIATDGPATAVSDVAGELLGVAPHLDVPPASGPPDNLQMLKGVGPRLSNQLNQNGIIRFEQLAGLSEVEAAMLDERMGAFRGRVARDRLIEQACYLARGDTEGFEAEFGKLGGSS